MKNTVKTIILSSAVVMFVGSTLSAAELQHRYSFNEPAGRLTVHDSVGGGAWDGALYSTNGGSGFTGSSGFTGLGTLFLSGTTNAFVDLPNNIVTGYTAVTFEAWVADRLV